MIDPPNIPPQCTQPPPKNQLRTVIYAVVIVLAILFLARTILVYYVDYSKEMAKQAGCLMNLSNIGKAALNYKTKKGEFPKDLQVLLEAEMPNTEHLNCPSREYSANNDYTYSRPTTDPDPKQIIACETHCNHKDLRMILYANGEVDHIQESQFQQKLAEPKNAEFAKAFRQAGGQ